MFTGAAAAPTLNVAGKGVGLPPNPTSQISPKVHVRCRRGSCGAPVQGAARSTLRSLRYRPAALITSAGLRDNSNAAQHRNLLLLTHRDSHSPRIVHPSTR